MVDIRRGLKMKRGEIFRWKIENSNVWLAATNGKSSPVSLEESTDMIFPAPSAVAWKKQKSHWMGARRFVADMGTTVITDVAAAVLIADLTKAIFRINGT